MKRYIMIILLLGCASFHAMDDVRIVPFDLAKHGATTQNIFTKTFYGSEPDAVLTQPTKAPNTYVAVLEKKVKNKPAKALGFAVWEHQHVYFHEAFADVEKDTRSKRMLDVCRLHYLAIASQHRKSAKRPGKGFGRALLNHVEQHAKAHNDDIIALVSEPYSTGFYDKNGYIKTMPHENKHLRAKPLNEDINALLADYITQRSQANPLANQHNHIQI